MERRVKKSDLSVRIERQLITVMRDNCVFRRDGKSRVLVPKSPTEANVFPVDRLSKSAFILKITSEETKVARVSIPRCKEDI